MENRKRRFLTCTEEDRLSNLPDHLIGLILERLPIQDAVTTSILSRKWRHRWTTMPGLVLDERFSNKFVQNGAFGRNGFIRIINHIFFLHNGPISKFILRIPKIELDSFQEVDQWMLLVSRNGVRELDFTNFIRFYQLPSYMFSCSELRKLTLENCIFKPPLNFEGFPNLEYLFFKNVDFRTNSCEAPIELPKVRLLYLYMCKNVFNFNVNAKKVGALYVIACPDAMLRRLLDSPCLVVVVIYLLKPIQDLARVGHMNLTTLLSMLPNVQRFFIDHSFLKFLCADQVPKWLPSPNRSLNRLLLIDCHLNDLNLLQGALCLLRNSPNLERLRMLHFHGKPQEVMNYDVGPASDHLESLDCFDHVMNKLQGVEITNLEGSRPQLLFIKLLLAHSPSLDKLIIRPSETSDAQQRLNVAKEVMRFPRASPKAEMAYLDPEPQSYYF